MNKTELLILNGFSNEMEKHALISHIIEAPLLWLAEAINAKSLLEKGTQLELGELKKTKDPRILAIKAMAKITHPLSKTPVRDFAALPSKKDILKVHRWPERMLSPLTAPYAAGVQRGKVLRQAQEVMPKDTFNAFRSSVSLNPQNVEKGEKYFSDLAKDIKEKFNVKPGKQSIGIKYIKNILEQAASTDPEIRKIGLGRLKNIKSGAMITAGSLGALGIIGAGIIGKTVYDKLMAIKAHKENAERYDGMVTNYFDKSDSQALVKQGFVNEMEKIGKLSVPLALTDPNIQKMQSALKQAMSEGIEGGLSKRFGFKGALTTGTAVAAGLVLGNYLSNMLAKNVDEKVIQKLMQDPQYGRRSSDQPMA